MNAALGMLLVGVLMFSARGQGTKYQLPRFEEHLVGQLFKGVPATPILTTSAQRRFRTRIREGISMGRGVWSGSWRDAIEKKGTNFAGHYIVIRWGCGSDCLMMAIVDAKTGRVYQPPLTQPGSELEVPMDPMSDREIDFRPNSTLMIFRNVCQQYREKCGVYAFNWKDNHFVLVRQTLVDLTKADE